MIELWVYVTETAKTGTWGAVVEEHLGCSLNHCYSLLKVVMAKMSCGRKKVLGEVVVAGVED